ncbi:MAG: putative glycosyltransferase [Solirubrobacterales bacterium]|nr:putative glycosyltransferase [Solirubrobacterales bacterium]
MAARIDLMGLPLDPVDTTTLLDRVFEALARERGGWVITPNLAHLHRFVADPTVRRFYADADLVVADGMPLVWASRLQRTPLPERVPGSGLIFPLCDRAAAAGASMFLVGGAPGAAEGAAAKLTARYPGLEIAGIDPLPDFSETDGQIDALTERIRAADPAIVAVCLGAPKQERLIERLRPALPRAWFFGLGITLSFVHGDVPRAPTWMQRTGLEWTYRLRREPRRLARRYLLEGVPFGARLMAHSARRRLAAGCGRRAGRWGPS